MWLHLSLNKIFRLSAINILCTQYQSSIIEFSTLYGGDESAGTLNHFSHLNHHGSSMEKYLKKLRVEHQIFFSCNFEAFDILNERMSIFSLLMKVKNEKKSLI